ncbi:MAG: DUF507 family protein [Vicinamibacteria bacterium]|nr:DUF507 family protein [Vicinamibacteria bacterium]
MKLSREKILLLSHSILDYLNSDDEIEYFVDPQELRREIVHTITEEIKADENIDRLARKKIESQKRLILEGSEEWEILYRKYYEEEAAARRKVV